MKLRRRIGSVFLAFAMALSLIPSVAVSALAADASKSGNYVSLEYETGALERSITVNVYINGTIKDTISVENAAATSNTIKIKVNDGINYEIDRVDQKGGGGSATDRISSDFKEYTYPNWAGDSGVTFDVYLREPLSKPDTPSGIYDGSGLVYFKIYEDQLLKLLHLNSNQGNITAATDIASVSLIFREDVGAAGSTHKDWSFEWCPPSANDVGYRHIVGGISNWDGKATPYNISTLNITYGNGSSAIISAEALRCVYQPGAGYGTYVIEANDSSCCAVAFYDSGDTGIGNAGVYNLHAIAFVEPGQTVTQMPEDPKYDVYHFAGWSTEKSDGVPFNESYVVNSDMRVWAQKYSSEHSSSLIYVDNTNDAFLDRFVELYNNQYEADISVDDVDKGSVKIQVNGENEEHTNPNYYTSPTQKTGWDGEGYTKYKIFNYNSKASIDENAPQYNKHIPFDEIQSITISAEVPTDSGNVTVKIDIPKGSDPGEFGAVVAGYEGGTGSIDGVFWLRMNQGEADDPVVPPEPGPGEAKLTVEKTVAIDGNRVTTASVGDTLEYTITVTNSGDAAANDVTVWDSLWTAPNGAVLVNGTKPYVSVADGFCTVDVPDNGETTIYYTYTVPEGMAGRTLTNEVWIGEKEGDPNTSNTVNVEELVPDTYPVIVYAVKNKDLSTKVEVSKENVSLGTPLIKYLEALPLEDPGFVGYTAENTWYKYDSPDFCFTDTDIVNGWINVLVNYVPNEYTLVYHGNGGLTTSGKDQSTSTVTYDSTATLKGNVAFTRDGYTFQGWATSATGDVVYKGGQKNVTISDTTFPGLSESGVAHLYAVWEKNAPTFEELSGLDLKVTIDCVSNVGHNDGQVSLIQSTPGNDTCVVEKVDDETDTYEIWVKDPDDYIAQYNQMDAANGYTHTYHGFDGVHYFTVRWDSTAEKWTVTQDKVTILAKCMPEAPTDDQLKMLLDDAVKVQCVEERTHNCTFDVKAGYTVSGPTADGKGGWTYTVTVTADPYVADFNDKGKGEHWLVEGEADTKGIVLTWDADHNTWTRQEQVEFDVTCKPEPVQTYEIDVDVINGTGTFFGTEVTTYILAMVGDDITIAFAPDAGYALDTVTVDGEPAVLTADGTYTFTNVAADHSITVVYATDAWNDEDDTTTGGDGIPDYKQVLIAYTTDGSGTVSPTTQVETLEDNADGKYVGTVNVGSTATANEGYAFAFWMGPNDSTFWSKDLNTTLKVEGGKTYTYTATFGTDLIGPEDPTGEDPDKPGDGIPDEYQVVVKYVAGKGGKITGKQVEVLTIYDADGHYSIVGNVTATGSRAAASHNWDFSRWVDPNGGVASWRPTLGQQTIEDAKGGNTYVFTARFRYDPYIPPVVDPDPDDPTPPVDPDKPQLNTEDHYAYIVGYEDGTVRPEGDITRAEVATIFFRLLTDESRNEYWSQTNDYTDVAEGDWYNNAVSTLSNAGILNGYEDGSFQPNGNITRAEFATIAARFFEATYEGEDLFPDIAGHWARDYINQAAHAGIVNGYENGTFRPQENITRAEAMTIVNRTLDRHPDADHFLADMKTWPDNPETAWYYEQVQEATNSHEYTMHTDDEQNPYEIWTELLPVRDWAQLEKEWSDAHSGQSGGDVV